MAWGKGEAGKEAEGASKGKMDVLLRLERREENGDGAVTGGGV